MDRRPGSSALPHFWWKGISPRAVIPLEANAVLGSPASCCQFAIGAARKIDKGAALQDVAAPARLELHQKCGRATPRGEAQSRWREQLCRDSVVKERAAWRPRKAKLCPCN